MSANQHPNSKFFNSNKKYEVKKFDRANNPSSKRREKRIEEENKLIEDYLKGNR